MTVAPSARMANKIRLAERRDKACKLAVKGWTYDRIAKELGYNSRQAAHRDVKVALEQLMKEQHAAAGELQAVGVQRIENAIAAVIEVMESTHVAHSAGKIVQREDPKTGELIDVIDHAPILSAAEVLRKLEESRRKLLGLDAPSRVEQKVDGTVSYQVAVEASEMEQL